MNIYIYAKSTEDMQVFDKTLQIIRQPEDAVSVLTESQRNFRAFEELKAKLTFDHVVLISALATLGRNDAEISTQLRWFIDKGMCLVICEVPSTYEFGMGQPLNQAILSTVLQSLLSGNRQSISVSFQKNHVGRKKLPFPDNWEKLYEKWQHREIFSKDFMEQAGVKKATFYNLLTEYKELQKLNEIYLQKYKSV